MNNWAKSVNAETQIPRKIVELKNCDLRNAYLLKLEKEYNAGTSVRHPERVKMYAELTGRTTVRTIG